PRRGNRRADDRVHRRRAALRPKQRLEEVLDRGQLALHLRLLIAQLLHLPLESRDLFGLVLLRRGERDERNERDGRELREHVHVNSSSYDLYPGKIFPGFNRLYGSNAALTRCISEISSGESSMPMNGRFL